MLGNFLPNVQIQNSENIDSVSPYSKFSENKIRALGLSKLGNKIFEGRTANIEIKSFADVAPIDVDLI